MPDTCEFRHSHNLTLDVPIGDPCGAPATHVILWDDKPVHRYSPACHRHLQIDPQASVKPLAILPAAGQRFFRVSLGIDYVICARDEAHVMEILEDLDGDFQENMREMGGATIREMSLEDAQRRTFYDGEIDKLVPIVTMTVGDWASSEF